MVFGSFGAFAQETTINLICEPAISIACVSANECSSFDNNETAYSQSDKGVSISEFKGEGQETIYFVSWGGVDWLATKNGTKLLSEVDPDEIAPGPFTGKIVSYDIDLISLVHTYKVRNKLDNYNQLTQRYNCAISTSLFDD